MWLLCANSPTGTHVRSASLFLVNSPNKRLFSLCSKRSTVRSNDPNHLRMIAPHRIVYFCMENVSDYWCRVTRLQMKMSMNNNSINRVDPLPPHHLGTGPVPAKQHDARHLPSPTVESLTTRLPFVTACRCCSADPSSLASKPTADPHTFEAPPEGSRA